MATLVTLTYTAVPVVITLAQLVQKMKDPPGSPGVILPTGASGRPANPLSEIGVSFVSDSTAIVGPNVDRTIVFSILPIFTSFVLRTPPLPGRFFPSVVSSSPADDEVGTGVQRMQLLYANSATPSVPTTATMNLNGTTPANFIKDNVNMLLTAPSIQVQKFGTAGVAAGLVDVYSGQNATGDVIAEIPNNFQGSIFSTDPNDTALGLGARTITITYMNAAGGGPFVEVIALNGTTPVNLVAVNHFAITNMVVTTAGAAVSSLGTITLVSGLNGTGGPRGRLAPSFYSYFRANPADTVPQADERVSAPFRSFFTHILASALATRISELIAVA